MAARMIHGTSLGNGEAIDVAFPTGTTVTDNVIGYSQANSNVMISPETAGITIGSTPTANDIVVFQVYREGTAAADTLARSATSSLDAQLIGVRIIYNVTTYNDT